MTTDEQTELNLSWRTLVEAVGLDPATVPALHNRGLLTVQSVEAITAVAKAVIENNRQWVIDQHLVGPFNAMADEIKSWRFHSHVETDGQSVRYVFPVGNARQLVAAQRVTDRSGALNTCRVEQTTTMQTMQRDIELLRNEVESWRYAAESTGGGWRFQIGSELLRRLDDACEQTDANISTPFPEEISE
jgi:hypothetical protein